MARNTEKLEKLEIHTVGHGLWQENRKKKRGKLDTNTIGPVIWREILKNVENE